MQGAGCRVQGAGYRVQGAPGAGCRVRLLWREGGEEALNDVDVVCEDDDLLVWVLHNALDHADGEWHLCIRVHACMYVHMCTYTSLQDALDHGEWHL